MAWIEWTAYPRLSGSPSVRELAEFFTPSADELAWAQAKTTSAHQRITHLEHTIHRSTSPANPQTGTPTSTDTP